MAGERLYVIRKGIPVNYGDSGLVSRVAEKSLDALATFQSGCSLDEFKYNAFVNFGHILDVAINNDQNALLALGRVIDFRRLEEVQGKLVDYRSILADVMSGGQVSQEQLDSLRAFLDVLYEHHIGQVAAVTHPEAHQRWFKEWN